MKKQVAALFLRSDSGYKKFDNVDCYDADRDATTFNGSMPVIAHPPCRAWGILSHMANPAEGEKELAVFAIEKVRANGGVLEHPSGSRIFKNHLPDVDEFDDEYGGYTILIDQFDFGHIAHKPTKIYICGCDASILPELPAKNTSEATRSITGFTIKVHGRYLKRCTQYQREYTPEVLMLWLIDVAILCSKDNQ
jgi:hypothetical protein